MIFILKKNKMEQLLSEFTSSTLQLETTEPEQVVNDSSECPVDKKVDLEKQTNHVTVNQMWVDRAVSFAKGYVDVLSVEDVSKEFSSSDFSKLSDFLHYNQLTLVQNQYFKVANNVTILKSQVVKESYLKWSKLVDSVDEINIESEKFKQFLQLEDIYYLNKCFYRSTPSFSKIKFLEIVLELSLDKIGMGGQFIEHIVLSELFGDELTALKIMVLGNSVGFWKIVDPEHLMPKTESRLRKYFCQIQLGVEINMDELYQYQKFVKLILDNMTIK